MCTCSCTTQWMIVCYLSVTHTRDTRYNVTLCLLYVCLSAVAYRAYRLFCSSMSLPCLGLMPLVLRANSPPSTFQRYFVICFHVAGLSFLATGPVGTHVWVHAHVCTLRCVCARMTDMPEYPWHSSHVCEHRDKWGYTYNQLKLSYKSAYASIG